MPNRYTSTVRLYNKDGNFITSAPLSYPNLSGAAEDAQIIAADPKDYTFAMWHNKTTGIKERAVAPMPTNISVRDHKTGRFVKWKNL